MYFPVKTRSIVNLLLALNSVKITMCLHPLKVEDRVGRFHFPKGIKCQLNNGFYNGYIRVRFWNKECLSLKQKSLLPNLKYIEKNYIAQLRRLQVTSLESTVWIFYVNIYLYSLGLSGSHTARRLVYFFMNSHFALHCLVVCQHLHSLPLPCTYRRKTRDKKLTIFLVSNFLMCTSE